MGLRQDGFAQAIVGVVLHHAPDFDPGSLEMRPSRAGNYLSLRSAPCAPPRKPSSTRTSELLTRASAGQRWCWLKCVGLGRRLSADLGDADFTASRTAARRRTRSGSTSIRRCSPGLAKPEHLLRETGIPLVKIDRRTDHLSRPRPVGGVSAARPASPPLKGAQAGDAHRTGGDRSARRLLHPWRTAPAHLASMWPVRRSVPSACGSERLHLPRPGAERGDGPGVLRAINPCGYPGMGRDPEPRSVRRGQSGTGRRSLLHLLRQMKG